MSRMFWMGEVGYLTESVRDETLAAFTAGAEANDQYLSPATWEGAPQVPAGIVSPATVFGLPGFTWGFNILDGWQQTQEWCDLADTAQGPSESGGYSLMTLPD